MKKRSHNPADFIVPLSIGGLEGRMLHIPVPPEQKHKREIMFVYGHHSSLERWWGLMEVLADYGTVTMPDLPGFGGMDSFYKVGQKPTLDAMADYLAAFIKWRYKRKRVTIMGMSYGFIVVTRMLQRYPELTKKVDMLVSVVGFAHHDELTFSRSRYLFYWYVSRFFSYRIPALLFRYIGLNSLMLRAVYARTHNAKNKFALAKDKEDFNRLMNVEIGLWQSNEVRTYMQTTGHILKADSTKQHVDLPVWHVSSSKDHFINHTLIEQHMRGIFSDFHEAPTILPVHAPSVIADAEMAAPLVPDVLRKEFAKS